MEARRKGETMTKQEKLIARYEKNLEKVRAQWGGNCSDTLGNNGAAYIEYAEKQLEAVKNGREW